ncbi:MULTISPECIES: hypothetical protein [Halorussus]|uniref:Uncharacterized protein n=2 Tax=Halorussus TaxID=1070314 RepID=A0A8U0HUR7_9EURY|nr:MULTISPECIES: hypothetical protein [Halorussus]UPV74589.1 hypothetical protein M0R89_00625 [Halorussus limi]
MTAQNDTVQDENSTQTNEETYTLNVEVFPHKGAREKVIREATITVPDSAVEGYDLSDDMSELPGIGAKTVQTLGFIESGTVGEFAAWLSCMYKVSPLKKEALRTAELRLDDRYSIFNDDRIAVNVHEEDESDGSDESNETDEVSTDGGEQSDINDDQPTVGERYTDEDFHSVGYYLGTRSDNVAETYLDDQVSGQRDDPSNLEGDSFTHSLEDEESLSEYVATTHENWKYEDVSELGKAMLDADRLADADLLTRKQAEVYALREIAGFDRLKTSSLLQITESGVDNHLAAAREKIESAEETLDVLDDVSEGDA